MRAEWEPDGVGIRCGCGSPCTVFDVCPGCGKTRRVCVAEAGPLPGAVGDARAANLARLDQARAAERDAIGGAT